MKIIKFLSLLMLIPALCFGSGSQDFDGANSKSTTNYATNNTSMSYSVWYKTDSGGEGNLGRFFDKKEAGAQVVVAYTNGADNNIYFEHTYAVGNEAWRFTKTSNSVWHHIVFTYSNSSPSNTPVIYSDGVSQSLTNSTNTGVGVAAINTDNFIIGNRSDQTRTFDGRMTYFAIYSAILNAVEANEILYKPEMIPTSRAVLSDTEFSKDLSGNGVTFTNTSLTSSNDGPPVMFGGGLPL